MRSRDTNAAVLVDRTLIEAGLISEGAIAGIGLTELMANCCIAD